MSSIFLEKFIFFIFSSLFYTLSGFLSVLFTYFFYCVIVSKTSQEAYYGKH